MPSKFELLPPELLRALWACLAPYGRMIEIGKAEINADAPLPMDGFARNSLFAADMSEKALAQGLLQTSMDLAQAGTLRSPSPLHVFGVDDVEGAFRYLASGKNSGRIVIRVDRDTVVQKFLIKRRTWTLDEKTTYLVAGGLGGLGRSIIRWMVTRGAKYLLVPSRSGAASAAALDVVDELSRRGVVMSTPKCDVASKDSLACMLRESAATLPPIRGCIVATMVLNDTLFDNMTLKQWEKTARSKIDSSWNLHAQLPVDLEFFIMLSSVSGVVGNPGQSNYAAGCTFQDALARHRNNISRSHGHPQQQCPKTISIDLGVMRGVGIVAETERLQRHFFQTDSSATDARPDNNSPSSKNHSCAAAGFVPVNEAELLSLLDICCDPTYQTEKDGDVRYGQVVVGLETPASFSLHAGTHAAPPEILQRPLFARLSSVGRGASQDIDKSGGDGGGDMNAAYAFRCAESVAARATVVVEALSVRLARTLSMDRGDVDAYRALHAYGVDSLIAVELRSWLGREFAADVPVFEIVSGKTVQAVGELVARTSRIEMK
ncbi:KR domain-containing protein [Astrocystis sublimbata]|nr:KR domain-containing protein [Astrocystis sublimbata]